MTRWTALLLLALPCFVATAQEEARKDGLPFDWAPPKQDWEWDEDERFDELMEQLAITDASLDAVQASLDKKTRRKSSRAAAAGRFEDNNRLMDRKGGGPMKWDEFYGTNAEKFFYHPIDPNTTYHTDTALRQIGKAEDDKSSSDIPTRQSLPVHQRPPQWDYIYRANETARQKALEDASLVDTEIEGLERRRTQLEQEQAILWCKLAFRAVQRVNMARKPLLRFEVAAASGEAADTERAHALSAAGVFLASALAVVDKAQEDQPVAFQGGAQIIRRAQETFEDSLLDAASIEPQLTDLRTDVGRFCKLSQMLADKAKTMAESYAGAMDGDLNKEAARKERFRAMLQNAVVDYAQILLALNELVDSMKTDWKVRVDAKRKRGPLQVVWSKEPSTPAGAFEVFGEQGMDGGVTEGSTEIGKPTVDLKTLRKKLFASKVAYDGKSGVLTLGYDFARPEQLNDWEAPETPIQRARRLKGVRVAPEESLMHRGVFEQAACRFQFAVGENQHRGNLISVGRIGDRVTIFQRADPGSRLFELRGHEHTRAVKTNSGIEFLVFLSVGAGKTLLRVNNNELASPAVPHTAFSFSLLGGENGTDFGGVEISGKPDMDWLRSVMQ